jgi:hypothetical protein
MTDRSVETSRVHLAISNFALLLAKRPGLAGVPVFEEPMALETMGIEHIVLAYEVAGDQSFRNLGIRSADEAFTLRGMIEVFYPDQTIEGVRATRARAFAIWREVAQLLRGDQNGVTLDGAVLEARLSSYRYVSSVTTERRVAQMLFDVDCQARLN